MMAIAIDFKKICLRNERNNCIDTKRAKDG